MTDGLLLGLSVSAAGAFRWGKVWEKEEEEVGEGGGEEGEGREEVEKVGREEEE
jgi:hypothetical protein